MTSDEYLDTLRWLLSGECDKVRSANAALYGELVVGSTITEATKREADILLAKVGVNESTNGEK